jgi:hypothetical protein
MLDKQTQWTENPCYYVIAFQAFRRAWLAGPYRTRAEADTVLPHVVSWATSQSGDTEATNYTYRVDQYHHGGVRSILGELNEPALAQALRQGVITELLEACKAALADYEEHIPSATAIPAILRAAIAKATAP